MNESEIQKLLDELKTAEVASEELSKKKKQAIDEIMPAEIKRFLEDIDKDFLGDEQAAANRIGELYNRIKEETLKFGSTVTGQFKQAVFVKGRVTWLTRELNGYAADHPEIEKFRQTGDASCSIREVKS
jgi:hypothetical protein